MGFCIEIAVLTPDGATGQAWAFVDLPEIAVGRSGAGVAMLARGVSDRHAVLAVEDGALRIYDVHWSPGATCVNGRAVTPGRPAALRDGDVLTIGSVMLLLRVKGELPAPPPAPPSSPTVEPSVAPEAWPELLASRAPALGLQPPVIALDIETARLRVGAIEWPAADQPPAIARRIADHLITAAQALSKRSGLWHKRPPERLLEALGITVGGSSDLMVEGERLVFAKCTWGWVTSHEQGEVITRVGSALAAALPYDRSALHLLVEQLSGAVDLTLHVPSTAKSIAAGESTRCRFCRGTCRPLDRHEATTCHGCAERHLGVIY